MDLVSKGKLFDETLISNRERQTRGHPMSVEPERPYSFDFAPTSLPKEFLEAIGLMSASWANLDSTISNAIGGLLDIDSTMALAITAHASLPQKFDQLKTLAHLKFGDESKQYQKILEYIEQAKSCQRKRNEVVHNAWCIDTKTGKVHHVAMTARGKVKIQIAAPTAEQVRLDAFNVNKLSLEIFMFLMDQDLLPHLPPEFETPEAEH
jgi:hypothetical protein